MPAGPNILQTVKAPIDVAFSTNDVVKSGVNLTEGSVCWIFVFCNNFGGGSSTLTCDGSDGYKNNVPELVYTFGSGAATFGAIYKMRTRVGGSRTFRFGKGGNSGQIGGFIVECERASAYALDGAAVSASSAGGTSITVAMSAISLANSLLFGFFTSYTPITWVTTATGFTTLDTDTGNDAMAIQSYAPGVTGSYTAGWSVVVNSFSRDLDLGAIAVAGLAGLVEQEGFRWRNDDGSETTATWAQSQDTNHTQPLDTNIRLRALLNADDDPASAQYQLEYKLSSDSIYHRVRPDVSGTIGTVTFGAIGTGANGSTTVAPFYPSGITAGQYLTLQVTSGATNSETPSTPSGWTLLATGASTDGSFGVDTGPRRVTVFGKVADGTELSTQTVSVSITNGDTCRGTICRWTKSDPDYEWSVTAVGADDSTSGTSFSATGAAIAFAPGDATMVAVGQRVDNATQSSQSLTASGITFGSRTNRATTAVTTGNDHRHVVDTFAAITAGTASVAPTWSYTASAAVSGGVVFVRLRTVAPAQPIALALSSNITAGGEATTAQLTAPSGKTTSDFTTGRMWDDENGTDSIDIVNDQYTEVEWCIKAVSANGASNGQVYNFRVARSDNALEVYSVAPTLTIGTGGISGVVNATLGALTSSATGTVAIAGTLSSTLGALLSSGTGALNNNGAVNVTLGALTSSATGALAITGTTSANLGELTCVATGESDNEGDVSVTLGELLSSGAGALAVTGTLDQTLGELTCVATGELASNTGTVDVTLGTLTGSATGALAITGTFDATLGVLLSAGAGALNINGTVDVTLGALTLIATGESPSGVVDVTLGALTCIATGELSGTPTQTLGGGGLAAYDIALNAARRRAKRKLTAAKARIPDVVITKPDAPIGVLRKLRQLQAIQPDIVDTLPTVELVNKEVERQLRNVRLRRDDDDFIALLSSLI